MLKPSNFVKIQISVPVKDAEKIRQILGRTGAGKQGNYEFCSGSIIQVGRFKPLKDARPAMGKIGKLEKVKEEVIQVICHKNLVKKVINEVKKVHPYEEPAIDIIPRYDIV